MAYVGQKRERFFRGVKLGISQFTNFSIQTETVGSKLSLFLIVLLFTKVANRFCKLSKIRILFRQTGEIIR